MEEKDYIKDLFAEKLSNAQAPVNPELWSAISSKIGTGTVVSTGLSTTAKWLIGLGTAASVAVATVLLVDSAQTSDKEKSNNLSGNPIDNNPSSLLVENNVTNSVDSIIKLKPTPEMEICYRFLPPLIDSIITSTEDGFEEKIINEVEQENIYIEPIVETIDKSEKPSDNVVKPVVVSSFEIKQLTNTFTLNNDGKNDLFYLEMKGIEDFVLTILNSKNEIVFKSTDANFKWDGLDLRGEQIPGGKYVYFFTGKDSQGNPISKSSNLTVIKN